ncbi:predicted protein, partial (plasmid) [Salmonella enterica subsp. enterica serovar Typhimurium str. SL1344]
TVTRKKREGEVSFSFFSFSAGDCDDAGDDRQNRQKDVAFSAPHSPGSGLPAVALWFSTLTVLCRVRAVPCIHRSRAVVDTRVKCTRRSPGPSFTSAAIFRSFDRSGFTVSPFSSRLPCASGCGFPCALASTIDRPTGMDARHRPVSRNM